MRRPSHWRTCMTAWSVAFITFACVFGGALAGMWLRGRLLEHHLREESKDMVRLVTGLIATLSALVLGLLIASSKSSFDEVNEGFKESAAKIILVDRAPRNMGRRRATCARRCALPTPRGTRSCSRTIAAQAPPPTIRWGRRRLKRWIRNSLGSRRAASSSAWRRHGRCSSATKSRRHAGWRSRKSECGRHRYSWPCSLPGLRPCLQAWAVRAVEPDHDHGAGHRRAVRGDRDLSDRGDERSAGRGSIAIPSTPMRNALETLGK